MNKTLTNLVTTISLIVAIVGSSPALAGEFFIGVNAGTSNFDGLNDACDDLLESNQTIAGLPVTCQVNDDSDTVLGLNAGYNLNRYLGLEVGYIDLGEYTADFNVAGVTVPAQAELDFAYAALVLTAPFTDKFSLSARAGGVNANAELSSPIGVEAELEDETAAFIGASVDYRLMEKLSLQLRYDYLSEIDITSLGLRYHF